MTNFKPMRRTAFARKRFKLRAKKMRTRWTQRWGRKFKVKLLNRARYWEARRLRQGHPDMTLGQSLVKQFLNELRRARTNHPTNLPPRSSRNDTRSKDIQYGSTGR